MGLKIYHEAPISMFSEVQDFTDGDYALVHLLDQNAKYRKMFVQAACQGRTIILDNSVFELGEPYDQGAYIEWIIRLNPDYYVVPDKQNDLEETLDKFFSFIAIPAIKSYPRMGVVQGKTDNELTQCYDKMIPHCDIIGIPFDHPSWEFGGYTNGRADFIQHLHTTGRIYKPIHLLGVHLPQEITRYRNYKFIASIDTSNPVVHGLHGIRYDRYGLPYKHPIKLHTLVDEEITLEQRLNVYYNMFMFRRFYYGN